MDKKRLLYGCGIVFIFVLLIAFFSGIGSVSASNDVLRERCVSVVEIKEGDTLWSVAESFYTPEYKNITAMVDEIKESNHIGDCVKIGQHIIVPHYQEITDNYEMVNVED